MIILRRAAMIAAILIVALGSGAVAQTAPIDFDGLPRKQQPAKPAADTGTTKLRRQIAAQRDSIARLRQLAKTVPASPVLKVDTVYVEPQPVVRVDTVKIPTAPATSPTPAPAAVVAPTFTPSGLTQVMLSGGDAARTTYRIRRVELKVTADLGNHAQAVLMVDAAKSLALNTSGAQPAVNQSSRMLQDAFISMPVRRMTIDAGQQRLPLGYEGSMGASGLETVERALMESDKPRGASFGDVRDAGVSVRRGWSSLDYKLGVFNGSGESMNDVDKQVAKAVVGQLAFHPKFLPGFRIGASGTTSGSAAGDNPTRDRVGADARFLRGPVAVQVEAMTGQDAATRRLGRYALATYAPRPRVKLVARVDSWDPDRASDSTAATVAEHDYLGGFTWLPAGTRLKLQLNVVRKTYVAGLLPSSTLVLSQLQASW